MINAPRCIKEDINFLENPNWIVAKRSNATHLIVYKYNGFYELKSAEGLPVRFDKIVLYFLLYKLFNIHNFKTTEVITTRYEIAKNILSQNKNFSKSKYDRIMLALKRWKAIYIKFEGIFYERDNRTVKYFSILDYVSLDKKTNQLSIRFNDLYIKQLEESAAYKFINFDEYKKLTRPISLRLYEILSKELIYREVAHMDIEQLGIDLTLEKKYPSQILASIKPAIYDINKYTKLHFSFEFVKELSLCIFRKVSDT